jgi:O-antigen ligase
MPENIRALVVILILAGLAFSFTSQLTIGIVSAADTSRRRNLWIGMTLAASLSHSFWLYAFVFGVTTYIVSQREDNPSALFLFLLFIVPNYSVQIPGLGAMNYLFALNHVRVLTFVVLVPMFLMLIQRSDTPRIGHFWQDRCLLAFLLLTTIMQLRATSLTDTLRHGFYGFVDVFLPYYVLSRSLRDLEGFRNSLAGFVIAAMILAAIGFFEISRHWLLYLGMADALGLRSALQYTGYLSRGGQLRAIASTGQPIVLGYVMVVAIAFYSYLKDDVRSRLNRRVGGLILAVGLIAPLSRGPWVGAMVSLVSFIWTGPNAFRKLASLVMIGTLALAVAVVLPGGEKVVQLLPFVGTIEKENIDYREDLLTNATIVIERNPWFGSAEYLAAPEMERMRQGQGIIDIVNTYVGITLEYGLVGLGLFVGFFVLVLHGIYKAMRQSRSRDEEMYRLGRALLAALVGILVTIFTTSSIMIIPVVYWSVAGLGVAYTRIESLRKKSILT